MPNRTTSQTFPPYFGWIDALRGAAALCVVIFHYQHFFMVAPAYTPAPIAPQDYPYGKILWPAFVAGEEAVRLFWVISGFVFAHVYWSRPTKLRDFAVARFARLYPLHIVTLLIVAALQTISMALNGHWQIYGNNDAYHFVLQIFMLDHTLALSDGPSFNGPVWSVSAELFAYALFFVLLPLLRIAPLGMSVALALLAYGAFRVWPQGAIVGRFALVCALFFFAGCAVYAVFGMTRARRILQAAVLVALIGVTIGAAASGSHGIAVVTGCCVIVFGLALLETIWRSRARMPRLLGDISYSLYLVHVPIQIAILIAMDWAFAGDRSFALSPWTLPAYLGLSVVVAHLVHVRFEKPVGRRLRTLGMGEFRWTGLSSGSRLLDMLRG